MLSRRGLLGSALAAIGAAFTSQPSAQALTATEALSLEGSITKTPKPKAILNPYAPPASMPSTIFPDFFPKESKQVIFYSPHPDDETLSFGMLASELYANGFEVHLVLLTQGMTTKAISVINGETESTVSASGAFRGRHIPLVEGYEQQTPERIGAIRINEFRAAAGLLKIPSERVHTIDTQDGDAYTVENIKRVVTKYAQLYPKATHVTLSTIDLHPQHRIAAEALRQSSTEQNFKSAYVVSRTTWVRLLKRQAVAKDSIPQLHWFKPTTKIADVAINATLPYSAWNPLVGAFAVGYTSVSTQFENMKSERNALYLLSTPPLEEVMKWIDTADEESVPAATSLTK